MADGSPRSWVGQSIERVEDAALLTGRGRYIDDLAVSPATLHAAVLRSPHPHALIRAIDVGAARAAKGVAAGLVLHLQHAHGAHIHDRAGHDRPGIDHQHVDRVAVLGERVRHEAVIARIAHRRMQEAVDHQRAGGLVELVLDRLAPDRHLDDDVDVLRRVVADLDGLDAHG